MIRSVNEMKDFTLVATDDHIGTVDDVYFDQDRWAIRYLTAETGTWLPGRRVLISPISISRVEWGERRLLLSITREQIERSPAIDPRRPVSRHQEMDYLDYYGYPYYWAHSGLWGAGTLPMLLSPAQIALQRTRAAIAKRRAADRHGTHLRSASEVRGCVIRAMDGDVGHVQDCLFDDVSWAVQYLEVNTRDSRLGERVLVAPGWITNVA